MKAAGYIFSVFASLFLCLSCGEILPERHDGEPADLTFTISIPELYYGTKAGYADGDVKPSDASSWPDWEQFVDGQAFYRLTIFLVRSSDNTLVAYRDFYSDGGTLNDYCAEPGRENGFCAADGTLLDATATKAVAARAHFSYMYPLHGGSGSVEKMHSGDYRAIVFANYSPVSGVSSGSGARSYGGLKDNGTDFTSLVDGIITAFNSHLTDGLSDFTASNPSYEAFFKYDIRTLKADGSYGGSAAEDYVCEQRPQPLSFIKDFLVLSGTQYVSGELIRTYSRIRLILNNDSLVENLSLNSFVFQTPFSQKQTYLFDFGDDAKYAEFAAGVGTPSLSSDYAIHKYPGDGLVVAPEGNAVLYDAYILESKRGAGEYQYKVDLEYKGISSPEVMLGSGTPIRTLAELKTAYNSGYFKYLIKVVGSDRGFLFDNTLNSSDSPDNQRVVVENYNVQESGVKCWLDVNYKKGGPQSPTVVPNNLVLSRRDGGAITDLRLDTDYPGFVWSFERTGDWGFFISNEATGQYWDNRIINNTANQYRLRTTLLGYSSYIPVDFVNGTTKGIAFRNSVSSSNICYLHRDGYGNVDNKKSNTNDMWVLYPCRSDQNAQVTKLVNLQILDPLSHQPEDLEELRRNDFIKVNIFASIQPDGGVILFKVIPWVPKEAEIVFE